MKNPTPEEVEQIREFADEHFEGDIDLGIAAQLYGLHVVKKCAGMPTFAEPEKIAAIREYIENGVSLEPEPPQPLEVLKQPADFTNQDIFRLAGLASSNNRAIRVEIAIEMFGAESVQNGKISSLANDYLIGQVKAKYTRLMNKNAETPDDTEAEEPETEQPQGSV